MPLTALWSNTKVARKLNSLTFPFHPCGAEPTAISFSFPVHTPHSPLGKARTLWTLPSWATTTSQPCDSSFTPPTASMESSRVKIGLRISFLISLGSCAPYSPWAMFLENPDLNPAAMFVLQRAKRWRKVSSVFCHVSSESSDHKQTVLIEATLSDLTGRLH